MKQVRELLERFLLEGKTEHLETASALYEAIGGIEGDQCWCEMVNSIDLRIKDVNKSIKDNNLVKELKEKMLKKSYKVHGNIAGNILLRPNDNIKLMGSERYEAFKKAFEEILQEKYLNDDLYKYYTNFNKKLHGFCSFERWLNWHNN